MVGNLELLGMRLVVFWELLVMIMITEYVCDYVCDSCNDLLEEKRVHVSRLITIPGISLEN